MKSKLRVAVYLTVVACLALFIGWLIPYWFARRYKLSTKKEWGLFYTISCTPGNCDSIAGTLTSRTVDFQEDTGTVEIFAVPVLATISFGLALVTLVLCLIVYNGCCIGLRKFHLYLGIATFNISAVVFTFITIVVAGVASSQFFKHRPISSVIEVPWSLISYSVGEIILVFSVIVYILLIRRYLRHRRRLYSSEKSHSGVYAISYQYYPRRNIHPYHGYLDKDPYNISHSFEFDHFGSGGEQLEPPPDYDIDTLARKPCRSNLRYASKPGYKRIPRRYRHVKDIDQLDSTFSEDSSTSKHNHHLDHSTDRRLPVSNVVKEKTVGVYKTAEDDRHYRQGDGKSSTESYTSSNGSKIDTKVNSNGTLLTRSANTSFFSDFIQSPGTWKTDISENPSVWHQARDYGSLTYAGKPLPNDTKIG